MPLTKSNCNKNPQCCRRHHPPQPGKRPEPGEGRGARSTPTHATQHSPLHLAASPVPPGTITQNKSTRISPATTTTNPNQNNHATPNLPPPIPQKRPPREQKRKKRHAATTQKLDPMETNGCYFPIRHPKISLNHL